MKKTFGERLKKIRTDAHKTGEDIAFAMREKDGSISTATYYNWENNVGAPDVNQLDTLAKALGVEKEKLL